MNSIDAIILGIVEGITEFLPISSTAHLILSAELMGLLRTDFLKTFEIVIQFGAMLALIILYIRRLTIVRELWFKVLIAFIPTGLIGFAFYKVIKIFVQGNEIVALCALLIGGLILIAFELFVEERAATDESVVTELHKFSYGKAALIGVAQALAVVPGVSRSAATIIAGRALGLSRRAIVEFSFLLAIPTLGAASAYDLYKNFSVISGAQFQYLIIGFIFAFLSAYVAARWLLKFIQDHNFIVFGFYRVILAIIFFFWII